MKLYIISIFIILLTNISYSAHSADLTRQNSLASDKKAQDFWDIYENVINKLSVLSVELEGSWIIELILIIQEKINDSNKDFVSSEDTNCFMNGIPIGIQLEVSEAAFIFQCDIYLSYNEEYRQEYVFNNEREIFMPDPPPN